MSKTRPSYKILEKLLRRVFNALIIRVFFKDCGKQVTTLTPAYGEEGVHKLPFCIAQSYSVIPASTFTREYTSASGKGAF